MKRKVFGVEEFCNKFLEYDNEKSKYKNFSSVKSELDKLRSIPNEFVYGVVPSKNNIWRIIEVENLDRIRFTGEEIKLESRIITSYFWKVSWNGKLCSYAVVDEEDSEKFSLVVRNLSEENSKEFELSEKIQKELRSSFKFSNDIRFFGSRHRHFYYSVNCKFLFLRVLYETMVIDLQTDSFYHKYSFRQDGYPDYIQQLVIHPLHDELVTVQTQVDNQDTFEMFRIGELKEEKECRIVMRNQDFGDSDFFLLGSKKIFIVQHKSLKVYNTENNEHLSSHYGYNGWKRLSKSVKSYNFQAACRSFLEVKNMSQLGVRGHFLIGKNENVIEIKFGFHDMNDKYVSAGGIINLEKEMIYLKKDSWGIIDHELRYFEHKIYQNWKVEKKLTFLHLKIDENNSLPMEILCEIFSFLEMEEIVRKIETISRVFRNNYFIWKITMERDWNLNREEGENYKIEYFRRWIRKDPMRFLRNTIRWENMSEEFTEKDVVHKFAKPVVTNKLDLSFKKFEYSWNKN